MKLVRQVKRVTITTVLGMVVLLAIPATSFAQGRGRGRGQGPNLTKKCGKFVNCHDARDGRWDGRGPNGSRVGRRIGIGDIFRGRRVRGTNRDNIIIRNRRVGRIDRDGDGDFDRNDRVIGRRQNRIERIERINNRRRGR